MRRMLVGLSFTLLIAGNADAGENQERQIERLEQENYRLSMEVSRLRAQLRQEQKRWAEQMRYRYPSNRSYGYGQSPLSGANRGLQDANQLKRNWDQLTR